MTIQEAKARLEEVECERIAISLSTDGALKGATAKRYTELFALKRELERIIYTDPNIWDTRADEYERDIAEIDKALETETDTRKRYSLVTRRDALEARLRTAKAYCNTRR